VGAQNNNKIKASITLFILMIGPGCIPLISDALEKWYQRGEERENYFLPDVRK